MLPTPPALRYTDPQVLKEFVGPPLPKSNRAIGRSQVVVEEAAPAPLKASKVTQARDSELLRIRKLPPIGAEGLLGRLGKLRRGEGQEYSRTRHRPLPPMMPAARTEPTGMARPFAHRSSRSD